MDEQLFNLLISTFTRFTETTKSALKDVKVHGLKQSDVAKKYGVSRQFIHERINRLDKLEKEFFENTSKFKVFLVKKDEKDNNED